MVVVGESDEAAEGEGPEGELDARGGDRAGEDHGELADEDAQECGGEELWPDSWAIMIAASTEETERTDEVSISLLMATGRRGWRPGKKLLMTT